MNKKECLDALNYFWEEVLIDSYEAKADENNYNVLKKLIEQYFEPKSYEFKDLKVGMWVYDTKPTFEDFRFIKITKILSKEECKYLYNDENSQVFFDNQIEYARDFEEGRYFPITKAMEEFEDDN